jgi:hypothetical protein
MRLLPLLLAAAVLAGCGSNGSVDDGSGGGGGSTDGPLSVEEALSSDPLESAVVEGILFAEGGTARLCGAIAESYPPQCPGAAVEVRGLDLSTVPDLQTAQGVSWRDGLIRLTGALEDGVLTVRQDAQL